MKDIVPELLEKIQKSFNRKVSADETISEFLKKIEDGTATMEELSLYGRKLGDHLAESLLENITPEALPDNRLYFNIANRILDETMHNNYDLVNVAAAAVQKHMDKANGIGLNAIQAAYPEERVMQVINGLSDKTASWEIIQSRMDEPVRNISQSFVDDFVLANVIFRSEAGLETYIIRTSRGKCCDWCKQLVGIYKYPEEVPKDVFRRHDNCKCTVTYKCGKYSKNIHNGNTGKRRYVQDKYGNYVKSKEARIEHAKKMAATENERAEAARQKRIATWQRKKEEKTMGLEERKALAKARESGIMKSFNIGKSVGAAAKNYPVKLPGSKQHVKLAEGQEIKGIAFAGKGTSKEIRDRFRLEAMYNIPADKWQKVSGKGYVIVKGKSRKAELHWYEADNEIVEMKVKRFYDES